MPKAVGKTADKNVANRRAGGRVLLELSHGGASQPGWVFRSLSGFIYVFSGISGSVSWILPCERKFVEIAALTASDSKSVARI